MATRYYLHGDEKESSTDSYFCAFCDLFQSANHFSDGSHEGGHRQRLSAMKGNFINLTRSNPSKFSRPERATNLIESWPKEAISPRSRFYRWLMRQADRDDPIGDVATDAKGDKSFPAASTSLNVVRRYLDGRGACAEALQALEEAWTEFSAKSNTRSSISLKTRFEVFRLCGYTCQICGVTVTDGAKLEVDHKVPVAKGGSNDIDNLWVLCFDCNRGKSTSDL